MPLESRFVAFAADMPFLSLEEPLIIAGMRGMAGHAAVVTETNQVIVGGSHLFADLGMASQTCIDPDRDVLSRMAIVAAGGVGLVQNIADQRPPVAAVRVMTGPAVARFGRKVGMLLPHRRERVTAQAERLGFLDQQAWIRRLVRLVAGVTLPFGVGRVGKLVVLGQPGMAGEAGFSRTVAEQSGEFRGVGIMAGQAFPLAHRLMHCPLTDFRFNLGMTGIAKVLHLLLEQSGVPGHVGAVAGAALPFGRRRMHHPLLEGGAVMAFETVDSRRGSPLRRQKEEEERSRDQCWL